MGDENPTTPPANTDNNEPPAWFKDFLAKQTPPTPPAAQPQSGMPNSVRDLVTAVQALPEQIVNALKEQAPQKPATEKKEDAPTPPAEPEKKATKPGKKTFAQMWFGN